MIRLLLLLVIVAFQARGQDSILSLDEVLGMVKRYHPAVKQADLKLTMAQAQLLEARGSFDPKLSAEAYTKRFEGKEYYTLAGGAFTIPTWFGIEVAAGFEQNDGQYLNPQNLNPDRGLASVGVKIPVGQGLFINRRMADLKIARTAVNQSRAERILAAVEVIHDAMVAYFDWKRQYDELKLYEEYVANAQTRLAGIAQMIRAGDRPGIDSVEVGVTLRMRLLNLEDAKLKLTKSRLELSNFLWADGNVPLELAGGMVPQDQVAATAELEFAAPDSVQIARHPKIQSLGAKVEMLDIERRLKANMLLPKVDLSYSWISQAWDFNNDYREDYRAGINMSFPLFLRKERGGLRLARFKVADARFEMEMEKTVLANKMRAGYAEIASLGRQLELVRLVESDQQFLLRQEERLFEMGESSVFLINSREAALLSASLQEIAMANRAMRARASLYRVLAAGD